MPCVLCQCVCWVVSSVGQLLSMIPHITQQHPTWMPQYHISKSDEELQITSRDRSRLLLRRTDPCSDA